MASLIICPSCSHQFEATDAFREELQRELNNKAKKWQEEKEEEYRKKEQQFAQQLQTKEREATEHLEKEKKKLQEELQNSLRVSIAKDFENRLSFLQQNVSESEEKLKEARKKELEFMQLEKELKTRQEEMELTQQRQLREEREKLKEQLQQDFVLRLREKDKQLEDQAKLVEEMRRKAEQGSTQLQGEILELTLEELLGTEFPDDEIREVKKGEEGGDIIQEVHNELKKKCGTIVWETKRAKNWSDKWIDKLKEDTQKGNADIAVLVSQAVPKDIDRFGRREGIWICCLNDARMVASILRESLIRHHEISKVLDNVSDKKETLYKYMTSNEFKQKWEAIIGTYMNMQKQITKEKIRVNKEWAEREKQLEIMLKNSMGFIGDVKGIGGLEIREINLLEEGEDE